MNNNITANAMVMIKNAGASRKLMVVLKNYSTLLENILVCLKNNGYIVDFKKFAQGGKTTIIVQLKYYIAKEGEFMKNYMKQLTINEFFEANKDKMFDMKAKIKSPKMQINYSHVIKSLNNKSTGSCVVFASYTDLYKCREQSNSFGLLILTTNKGVLSHIEAIEQKVGGKVLLGVY